MTAEPTGLFQRLAPLLVNRTVIMTVAADGKGLLTLNVIPKKVKDDESDALTTALCITASAEELDRDLAAQLREFTDVHAKAATNFVVSFYDSRFQIGFTEQEKSDLVAFLNSL